METPDKKNTVHSFAFFLLMTILGLTVVVSLGYMIYSVLFG
ncbi:MAG TPA: hypothetical protein PLZ15_04010 [Melioribacteraceae bacterium]|nr:hypothetical protein [Melioribacteraceae bacterium]